MEKEQGPYIEDVDDIIVLINGNSPLRSLVHPFLLVLVEGVCDENCILSVLSGCTHILQQVWGILRSYWRRCIVYGCKNHDRDSAASSTGQRTKYFDRCFGIVRFPQNQYALDQHQCHYDINITMMPFIISNQFETTNLPAYLRTYWENFIKQCHIYAPLEPQASLQIGFLTIREGFVEPGETLFGCGEGINIHCYSRLELKCDPSDGKYICTKGNEALSPDVLAERHEELLTTVGGGIYVNRNGTESREYIGGIYMATNVPNACRFWNFQIEVEDTEVSGWTRNVEHLIELLPRSCNRFTHKHVEVMEENTLYWFTDRTPYEWIPLSYRTYQQVIQCVLTDVSVWFEEFSTPNPLGVYLDPNKTKIVKSTKSEEVK